MTARHQLEITGGERLQVNGWVLSQDRKLIDIVFTEKKKLAVTWRGDETKKAIYLRDGEASREVMVDFLKEQLGASFAEISSQLQ